jgi:peptidase A4-like protein
LFAAPALAATTVPQATSQNWSGYVVSGSGGSSSFSSVSGSWVQPSANTTAGEGYSAFWVGLGGTSQSSSLEQVGTQADVVGGQTVYYAWYELLPAAQVRVPVAIHPGDHISASVTVKGGSVTVALSDTTTGSSFTKTLQMSAPDTSSAEWIAEAPSASVGYGNYQTLPLADFGSVGFTGATATAGGHTGGISDPNWTAQAVQLNGSAAGAQPAALSTDGSSFSVAWQGGGGYGGPGYVGTGGYGYGAYGYGGSGYGGYGPPGWSYGY